MGVSNALLESSQLLSILNMGTTLYIPPFIHHNEHSGAAVRANVDRLLGISFSTNPLSVFKISLMQRGVGTILTVSSTYGIATVKLRHPQSSLNCTVSRCWCRSSSYAAECRVDGAYCVLHAVGPNACVQELQQEPQLQPNDFNEGRSSVCSTACHCRLTARGCR